MTSSPRNACPRDCDLGEKMKEASRMRKLIIWTIAPAALTLSLLLAAGSDTAAAKKTAEDCTIGHKVCY
jgi:hypothetical protein